MATQKGELHLVFAYLWAVSHKLVGGVALKDLSEKLALNGLWFDWDDSS